MVQYIKEAMKPNNYFEARLGKIDESTEFRIGLATKRDPVELTSLSNGLHCCCFSLLHRALMYTDIPGINRYRCESGDTIACHMISQQEQEQTVCFYLNGRAVGLQTIRRVKGWDVYPSIVFGESKFNVDMKWSQQKKPYFSIRNMTSWVMPISNISVKKNMLKFISKPDDVNSVLCHSTVAISKTDLTYYEVKLTESINGTFPRVGFWHLSSVLQTNEVEAMYKPESGTVGDTVGCQAILSEDIVKNPYALVKFFKNKDLMKTALVKVPLSGLFIAVEFISKGDAVEFNFDATILNTVSDSELQTMTKDFNLKKDKTETDLDAKTVDGKDNDILRPKLDVDDKLGTATFISHTYLDIPKVNFIFTKLLAQGFRVDMSCWHPEVASKQKIIEAAEVVIFCLSAESIKDKYQQTEFKFIRSTDKSVVPVLLEDINWPLSGDYKMYHNYITSFGHMKLDISSIISDEDLLSTTIQKANLQIPELRKRNSDTNLKSSKGTKSLPAQNTRTSSSQSKACDIL